MKTITFDRLKTSSIALEFDELIPDEIYAWSEEDFAKYEVPIGNSRFPITDFFDITVEGDAEGPNDVKMILNGDLNRVKYIGCKMSGGEIVCNGNVDLHVGAEMSGGSSMFTVMQLLMQEGKCLADTLKSTVTPKNSLELLTLVNGEV